MDIGIIGAGNMGAALIRGLAKSKGFQNLNIHVYDIDNSKASKLIDYQVIVEQNVNNLVNNCSIVIIAVKPNTVKNLVKSIKDIVCKKLIISIAVGIPIDFYLNILGGDKKVVRVMPNIPVLVNEGMSVITFCDNVDKEEQNIAIKIFESVGCVQILDETLMTEVTALTGSSPAYIFIMIEAMADAAVASGIPRDIAIKMAAQAVYGSAKMVIDLGIHPAVLKDQVCSPAGTTIEAVRKLEKCGFRNSIISAMDACTDKAIEINNNFLKKGND